ncbi:MAG: hypothetical protein FJ086_04480 [Deltaproteobacteria bacterium]|nr:hypothetical protein [Deltaproteobacteria bacterium]
MPWPRLQFLPLLCAAACARPAPIPAAPPPTVQLRDVHVVRSAGSEVTLTGTLQTLSFRRNEGRYAGEGARFRVKGQGGAGDYEVAAPRVTGLPAEQKAEGTGGVTLTTDHGLVGTTSSARLDGKAGVVTGAEPLEASGPGYTLQADGFQLSVTGGKHRFEGNVRTRLEATR